MKKFFNQKKILNEKLIDPTLWNDKKKAKMINQQIIKLEEDFKFICNIENKINDLEIMIELIEQNPKEKILKKNLEKDLDLIKKNIDTLEIKTLLSGKYDCNNAILSLHAGAGGVDAQDWTEILCKMYLHWAKKNNYKIKILDSFICEEGGIKNITFSIIGKYAYGYLKSEQGVHRLIRISPFNTNRKRHTSFSSVEVLPENNNNYDIFIKEEDIKVDTYKSSGSGGQHVNKTDSAVRITHLLTNIVVQCQSERSQLSNRNSAMKILESKLLEKKLKKEANDLKNLRKNHKEISWGNQIRSYVFHPYQLVKDHRINYETSKINDVLNGEIDIFIKKYLVLNI